MKNICILGSTGSIGRNSLEVIENLGDNFKIVSLSAFKNITLLENQIRKYKPRFVSVANEESKKILERKFKGHNLKIFYGIDGLIKIATLPEVNFVLSGIVGGVGLPPLIKAIEKKKDIGLANKESLVMAGELITKTAKKKGVRIIPVDSEHSAIFQCLKDENKKSVKRIILTASGGPFYKRKNLKNISIKEALAHPTWKMGKKITIDSATLMNKGLEVIEAHYLFDIPYDKIKIVIHPQSIVHSAVEFCDGSILAQLSHPDMKLPIQYALTYPERVESRVNTLELEKIKQLDFDEPDFKKFPCIKLAYWAGKTGGTMPTVMNASNEVAVDSFLHGRIRFTDIANIIHYVLEKHKTVKNPMLNEILDADRWARDFAHKRIKKC